MEFFDTFITKIKVTKIVITQFRYACILLHHTLVQKNIAEALNIVNHLCQYHLLLIVSDSCQNSFSRKIIIWLGSEIGLLSDTWLPMLMELAEWLVHWAPKLGLRVRCSTRSSP